MSASEIRKKWPNTTDAELLILTDPNSRLLLASYDIKEAQLLTLYSSCPWARAIVWPNGYHIK